MTTEQILSKIFEDNFNEFDYSFEYDRAEKADPLNVRFEKTDGYIILDEDNDSTYIEYEFTYDEEISYCSGDDLTPPSSNSDSTMYLTIRVYEDYYLKDLNEIDKRMIKERIKEVIKF